jgi:hypothetical protein
MTVVLYPVVASKSRDKDVMKSLFLGFTLVPVMVFCLAWRATKTRWQTKITLKRRTFRNEDEDQFGGSGLNRGNNIAGIGRATGTERA